MFCHVSHIGGRPFNFKNQQPTTTTSNQQRRGFARWRGTINFQLPVGKLEEFGWRWTSGAGGWNVKPGWRNTFPSDKKTHLKWRMIFGKMMEFNGMLLLIIFLCEEKIGKLISETMGFCRLLLLGAKVKYLMNFWPWWFTRLIYSML